MRRRPVSRRDSGPEFCAMRGLMHGLHGLHGFHWLDGIHRLHSGAVLVRFFKRWCVRMVRSRVASHGCDVVTLTSDKVHATSAHRTQNKILGGAKELRW